MVPCHGRSRAESEQGIALSARRSSFATPAGFVAHVSAPFRQPSSQLDGACRGPKRTSTPIPLSCNAASVRSVTTHYTQRTQGRNTDDGALVCRVQVADDHGGEGVILS